MELRDDADNHKEENAQEEDLNKMNRLLEKLYNKLGSQTALERVKICIVCLFLREKTLLRTQFTTATSGSFNTFRQSGVLVDGTDSQWLAILVGMQN